MFSCLSSVFSILIMKFESVLLLFSVFKGAFGVETTVHLSTGVATSVCQQQQDYVTTETLQPPAKSQPQSGATESESECQWLTIPKVNLETGISRRSCSEFESGSGSRIVGGEVAGPYEFPALVALFFLNEPPTDKYRKYVCGGSIISENWVLTAAHCIKNPKPANNRIVAGSNNISDTTEPIQTRDVDKIIIHPKYSKVEEWEGYDIALMHVTEPFVFDDKVESIGLPKPGYQPKGGDKVTAVGRGGTSNSDSVKDFPRKANFTVVSEAGCKKAAGNRPNPSDTIFCARVKAEDAKDVCFGDSGSLILSYGEDGVPVQIGIISFGAGVPSGEKSNSESQSNIQPRQCASFPGVPFGSISVAKLLDWIQENTAE